MSDQTQDKLWTDERIVDDINDLADDEGIIDVDDVLAAMRRMRDAYEHEIKHYQRLLSGKLRPATAQPPVKGDND